MNWFLVVAAALCAALAAGIATLVVRRRREQKWLHAAVAVVSFALLLGLSRFSVVPPLQARWEASRVDAKLSSNPAFAAIKKHDAATYERIMSQLRTGLLEGRDQHVLLEAVRAEVSQLVQKRLPRASDDAAVQYMRVMVQEMQELRTQGADFCYRFLFAAPGQGLNLAQHVSANTMQADYSALSQVVRTSTESPQPVPQQAEVAAKLEPVVAALAGRYGRDIVMLQQPQAPTVDKTKLCDMNIDLYSVILQMPVADSGRLIRYLMGSAG